MIHAPSPIPITPERWIIQLFAARAAAEGGIVRRRVRDVDRLVGREWFVAEIRRRGFRVARNAGHRSSTANRVNSVSAAF